MCYPRYNRRRMPGVNGREVVEEHVDADHVRVYFPDHQGRLRLIFINHEAIEAVSERILLVEFGVSYLDLRLDWAKSSMNIYLNLDDRCLWPKELFPDGQPASMAMPDLPGLSARDAWI